MYREEVLDCAIRAFQRQRFDAEARIDVAFVDVQGKGEGSVDEGELRREFLRLLMQEVQHCKILEGPEESRSLALHGDGKLISHLLCITSLSTLVFPNLDKACFVNVWLNYDTFSFIAVQEGLYRTIGKMISVALVQGGLPIHFFSERLYCQISALPPPKFTLEEVADHDIRSQLEKVSTTVTKFYPS